MPPLTPQSPQGAERRLSRLLARWAETRRLSGQQAEAIRRAVVASPAPSDFDRWWRLLDPVDGTAFRASRRRSVEDVVQTPTFSSVLTLPSSAAVSLQTRVPNWPVDEPDYQPYLRL